jgi:hypothetical protein
MLSRAALAGAVLGIIVPADQVVDLVPVLLDHSLDLLTARARLGTRVRDRTAKSNIVANEIGASRIRERVLHVCLFHLEVTIDIATVVCLVAFRHLLKLHA